ncbi:MAG: peptide chain release factor 2 [Desulfovibrionales bacterium]|jgi:peptide chain release factor 2|nr:peptide chain release factor 2 [Desulfovibrionales bacterium]
MPNSKPAAPRFSKNSTAFGGVFDVAGLKKRMEELEAELAKPEAWSDPEAMTPLLKEKSRLGGRIENLDSLGKARGEAEEWLEMAEDEQTEELLSTLHDQLDVLDDRLTKTEMATLLGQEEDASNALLAIHPGAGGVDAQDWAEMLLRMYRRFCERQGFEVKVLDMLDGEEAGIKSVTLQCSGDYAYGLLKGETGIHRLIRISPFDASGRRHTAFASVEVLPDVDEDIEIEVKEEDLRIDVFRSSGPGGQHVNKTNSAVRITHLPTGIVVSCQNEKSQFKNKDMAMKILKARLYRAKLQEIEDSKRAAHAIKDAIAWGSQIRTYTLQPYRLVKDHRTNCEIGNVDAVLDGEIDELLRNYLLTFHAGSE